MKLDSTDIKLINLLQEDCKQPIKELASALNLSIAPVHERIKKLERNGLIKRYVAIVDLEKTDKSLINYCCVSVLKHRKSLFTEFENRIREMDEVLECYYISGNYDYLLKIVTSSMNEYQSFVIDKLSDMEMISNINTQFVLRPVKFTTSIKMK